MLASLVVMACGDDPKSSPDVANDVAENDVTEADTVEADTTITPDTVSPDTTEDVVEDVGPDMIEDDTTVVEDTTDTTDTTDEDVVEDVAPDVPVGPSTCADLGITPIAFAPSTDDPASFALTGRFPAGGTVLTSACAGTVHAESVIVFTAPTAGLWELTTDGPGTTSEASSTSAASATTRPRLIAIPMAPAAMARA